MSSVLAEEKLNRKRIRTLMRVYDHQPWVRDCEDAFLHLLDECIDLSEQDLVVKLLSDFCYLEPDDFRASLVNMRDWIQATLELPEATTQIVATTFDRRPDSGQAIVYALKPLFQAAGWTHHRLVNRVDKCIDDAKAGYTNIVLVDEFIGSGETASGRVETMRNRLADAGVAGTTFYFAAVAGMKGGIERTRDLGIQVFCDKELDKGISEKFPAVEVAAALERMKRLESTLSTSYLDEDLPSLGYEASEALYARRDGNSPNNVFPVFWWPENQSNAPRPHMLIRAFSST